MSDFAKLARPYAKAVFEYAQTHNQLENWALVLHKLAMLVKQPEIEQLLKNPQYSLQEHTDVCIALLQDGLEKEGQNFIRILAGNHRLSISPDISQLFDQLRAASEKILTIRIKSAIVLNDGYRKELEALLSKKFEAQVVLQYEVDPEIMGGLIIYAGDRVIDSSVRGQFTRLREAVINTF